MRDRPWQTWHQVRFQLPFSTRRDWEHSATDRLNWCRCPVIATLPTQQRIDEIAGDLAPDVVRIRFRVAQDWSEQPAIYFRVVLADDASRGDRLAEVTGRVRARLFDELGLESLDHIPYFRFRSQSEQARLNDPAWG